MKRQVTTPSSRAPIHVVWLKRDLRVDDHQPIWEASQSGQVVVLYVFEPKLWSMPEMDRSHFAFIVQSLDDLSTKLELIGGRLAIRTSELPEAFIEIANQFLIAGLYSHEETGNGFTYDRDRRVAKWASQNGVPWKQCPQNGVVRPLLSRNGWSAMWQQRMSQSLAPTPRQIHIPLEFDWGRMPTGEELGLPKTTKTNLQIGGSSSANETLQSFLTIRGADYRKGMSSPNNAWDNCSRLSPYLAWGSISMKTVHKQMQQRQQEIRQSPRGSIDPRWAASLSSFASRLSWHCHFMQKLEDEPR